VEAAFLHVVQGPRKGLNVPLPTDRPVVIGRKRGDFLLDDPLVSSAHCRLSCAEGRVTLADLGSTNGTLVDGRAVRECVLRPGSEIAVGGSRFILYVGEEATSSEATGSDAQPDIAWLLDEELVEVRKGDPTAADVIKHDLRLPPGVSPVLEVVAGPDSGKVFRCSRGNVSIGRRTGEVPLSDGEVSRHHAVIEVFGREMMFLRDLGSTNGTYHNGRRVSMARVRGGDHLGCGRTVLRLVVSG
jgi:pSer/pThr/pTyr-binding forkhead associated (FHA) protein